MNPIVGIDLGTTYSALACLDEVGVPHVVPIGSERIVPSCVYVPAGGQEKVVGEYAKRALPTDARRVLRRFKRLMDHDPTTPVPHGPGLSATGASSKILSYLAAEASKQIGPVRDVVITVPANFADKGRRATIKAAEDAGLNVKVLINEPTAAALAFAAQHDVNGKVLVYDLGGGTFDVSIVQVTGKQVDVLTSEGDDHLGGVDFDEAIGKAINEEHRRQFGETLTRRLGIDDGDELKSNDWWEILLECEGWKKQLSQLNQVEIRAGFPPNRLTMSLAREVFEDLLGSAVAQTEIRVETALDNLQLHHRDIDHILLVGGSTRIPAFRQSLKKLFGKTPLESVNADEAVALGAAIRAGLEAAPERLKPFQRERLAQMNLTEVTNKSYGTLVLEHDESLREARLVNVEMISKDTVIPCRHSRTFFTVVDDQRQVKCRVTEADVKDETDPAHTNLRFEGMLGPFPAGRPAGQAIEVNFSYDKSQVMHVSFTDVSSGKQIEADISLGSSKTTNDDIPTFTIE